ncbi:hypothetical protein ACU8V7_25620 [Zobellia nedashkovskayae]
MKKLIIGVLILGFASLANAQNAFYQPREFTPILEEEPAVNSDYQNLVKEGTIAPKVLKLQDVVANFKLEESKLFRGDKRTYEVIFRKANGRVYATFNGDGKILYSREIYTNAIFPVLVRNTIYREYPGWYALSNQYMVSYSVDLGVKKVYRVKIGKGQLQKTLKLDADGTIL